MVMRTALNVLSSPSTQVEAYFEGANNVYKDAPVNFASKKIVLREAGTARNNAVDADRSISTFAGEFYGSTSTDALGLTLGG